jgi:arginase family enzyme
MISQYLELPDFAFISEERKFKSYELGFSIQFYEEDLYDFAGIQTVLLGVKESRAASMKNLGCDLTPDEVRKHLFRLHGGEKFPKILDLGNIIDCETVSETYEALEKVLSYIYEQGVTVLIIGGSQDLTYSQYIAFENIKPKLNVAVVDERIDLVINQETLTSDGYLQHLMTCQNPQLYHLSLFGYQTFFVHPSILNHINSMSYDSFKLGDLRYDVIHYNHVFRMADMISMDISVVKQSDAPGRSMQSPNGFLADEFCLISRLAGMSDRVQSIGFYEVNPQMDIRHQTAQLTAQAMWYFLDGFGYRTAEHPSLEDEQDNYLIFLVDLPEFESKPFQFWQSKETGNWWVEIPDPKSDPGSFFPCSRSDYEACAKGEMSSWVFNLIAKVI